ncbi:uroporphyrinogen-III C-methyltransferase [Reinekea thalattae]|uniref:Heme biosynthesis operon protein HemX n=1 Tax=Reinekea thalattae TaxID=2593301 RepID=A0A5C8Z4L6_9GAMM|nr:uroporphyrinogen-III C-methyltransferase [Reinekea thalattae]TXR51880.1 hypothetical protein FME95_10655 [Reinekea thalattae]
MNESDKQPSTEKSVETAATEQVTDSNAALQSEQDDSADRSNRATKSAAAKRAARAKKRKKAKADSDSSVAKTSKLRIFVTKKALALYVICIAIAAIAYAGYWLKDFASDYVEQYKARQALLVEQIEQQRERIEVLENKLDQSQQGWQQASDELEELVVESAQRLNQYTSNGENQWPLEEALTLTRLAQQRLQLDSSATMAVRLLKSADSVLAGQDQAAVLPLRRQLAADILALNNVESADINGHYFALEAIADQIRQLEWLPKPAQQQALADDVAPSEGFLQSLQQIVVVRRLDVPMQAAPLQTTFEQWRQQTLLRIEQTQLALLARNQPLYDSALQQSQSLISQMQSQVSVDAYLAQLTELSGAELNPSWPDISASTELIEQYISEYQTTELSEGDE